MIEHAYSAAREAIEVEAAEGLPEAKAEQLEVLTRAILGEGVVFYLQLSACVRVLWAWMKQQHKRASIPQYEKSLNYR